MKQITEDYVSFEIAKLLQEKGFEQECDYATSWYAAEYYKNSAQGEWFEGEYEIIKDIEDKCTISYLSDKGIFIPAPTQALALKWLREVYNIHVEIRYVPDKFTNEPCYKAMIWDMNTEIGTPLSPDVSYTYFETCVEEAIKYTLEKLI